VVVRFLYVQMNTTKEFGPSGEKHLQHSNSYVMLSDCYPTSQDYYALSPPNWGELSSAWLPFIKDVSVSERVSTTQQNQYVYVLCS
jgi:hypothetical protein